MSQTKKTLHEMGKALIDDLAVSQSNVTQLVTISTGVTSNTSAGIVTTITATTAANLISTFTVTNSSCFTTSIIFVDIQDYSGTTGLPSVYVDDILDGSFKINLCNNHASAIFNGIFKIGFLINNI